MATRKDRPLVSFDWAAKKILRDKANFDILEGFLATLLKQEIKIVSILESESTPEHATDKFNKVDLLVEDQHRELLIIEIQNNREVHYLERLLYGASKLIIDHVQLGESYEKIKKVISISILYFLLGEGETDYVYHGSTAFHGLHDGSKLELKRYKREALLNGHVDVVKKAFPEYYLIEVQRFQDIIQSDLDEWIYFFKNSEIKDDFKAKNIQLLREKLDLLKMPEGERNAYERYLMNKASEKDVIETAKLEGKLEGKIEGKIEIAQAMLAAGLPHDLISKLTGIDEIEIFKLRGE